MTKKRGANNNGTVRKRPNGTWEGRAYINGARKSFYGNTQADVVKIMRSALDATDKGIYIEPSRLKVNQWLDLWLKEYVESSVKPLTLAAYISQCKTHIKPAIGYLKLSELNATHIQKLYNDMTRIKCKSPKTVRNTHGVLHKALEKAVQLRYIAFNPSNACTLPRIEKTEIEPLTETEIKLFLEHIESGEYLKDLFTIAVFTGMRESEVCGLSWDSVNFENGTITIRQQLSKEKYKGGKCYIAKSTKSDKIRIITPAPFIMTLLKTVKAKQAENRLKMGKAWLNEWNLVFTNETGRFYFPQTVLKRFKRVAASIGRTDARFHDLRHTFAVMSLQEGDDIKTVQSNLGHATASFTLDVYGHVSDQMRKESAARMERYIQHIKNS